MSVKDKQSHYFDCLYCYYNYCYSFLYSLFLLCTTICIATSTMQWAYYNITAVSIYNHLLLLLFLAAEVFPLLTQYYCNWPHISRHLPYITLTPWTSPHRPWYYTTRHVLLHYKYNTTLLLYRTSTQAYFLKLSNKQKSKRYINFTLLLQK